jgi:hypothetical protein
MSDPFHGVQGSEDTVPIGTLAVMLVTDERGFAYENDFG